MYCKVCVANPHDKELTVDKKMHYHGCYIKVERDHRKMWPLHCVVMDSSFFNSVPYCTHSLLYSLSLCTPSQMYYTVCQVHIKISAQYSLDTYSTLYNQFIFTEITILFQGETLNGKVCMFFEAWFLMHGRLHNPSKVTSVIDTWEKSIGPKFC